MSKVIFISRDKRFSPNSVEKDAAILKAVAHRVRCSESLFVEENALTPDMDADIYVSMARLPQSIEILKGKEREGKRVINSAFGVESCRRSHIDEVMRQHALSMPPSTGENGYWIKRGDAAAQEKGDVVYCKDAAALEKAKEEFARRGVTDYTVSAHVVGDVVKFYATTQGFFRLYYPADDHISKFGDEQQNGVAHHYAFSEADLKEEADKLARLLGVAVYGGDAIVTPQGKYYIIDFNDWPSFSRCKDEAADSIAKIINE